MKRLSESGRKEHALRKCPASRSDTLHSVLNGGRLRPADRLFWSRGLNGRQYELEVGIIGFGLF